MAEIRSILAATDLSAPARRAVDRAAGLAQRASAPLTLAHVVSGSALDDLRRWLDVGGDPGQSIVDEVRERLHDLARELHEQYGIEVDERILTGRAVDEIARVADEVQADVVVTGTLGAGFLRGRLLGSTAERIVRKSTRPVLLVRQSPRAPYRRVLVTVDFSRWSSASLEIAAAIAPAADFVLFHCIESFERLAGVTRIDPDVVERHRTEAREDATRRLHELAEHARLPAGRVTAVTRDSIAPWFRILEVEQEQDCDLIVLGKHGANAFEEVLLGSTTNAVINESHTDVLISTRAESPR